MDGMTSLVRAVALVFAVAACGGGDPAGPDGGLLDAGPGDHHVDRVGTINLFEGGGFLSVFAAIGDQPERPVPSVIASAGDCAVYRRPPPALCSPVCDGVCEPPGVCHPWARTVDVGTITVTGLRQPLAFVPGEFGYQPQPAPPADLFDAGDPIAVRAPGGEIAGFAVEVRGVATLTGVDPSLTLVDGQDLQVTWTPDGGGARVELALLVGWHGAPWEAMLRCETDDDGALTVDGALVAALPRASSGLESHTSTLSRLTRATVLGPHGVIEIAAGSQVPVYFTR